jgi:hypothetical protein
MPQPAMMVRVLSVVTCVFLSLANVRADVKFNAAFNSAYRARIKKSHFCDPTVKCACYICVTLARNDEWPCIISVYTGYIDIQAKHLFFYFFESRSDPDQDDVILWTNGGEGFGRTVASPPNADRSAECP